MKRYFWPTLLLFAVTLLIAPILGSQIAHSVASGYTYSIYPTNNNQINNPPQVTDFSLNSTVVIEGTICPNPIIGIGSSIYANVTYTRPDGSTFVHSTTISQFDYCTGGGDLVDSISANVGGTWHVQSDAIIDWGNGTLTNLASNQASFTVRESSSVSSIAELVGIPLAAIVIIALVGFALLKSRRKRLPPPPP